jgi:integrase
MDVKIYKRKDSPYWWMWYYVSDGSIKRKSTKTKNKRNALKIAKAKEAELVRSKGLPDAETVTLKDLVQEVLNDYRMNRKKSGDKVVQRSKNLYDYFGEEKKIIQIHENEIDKYINKRMDSGIRPSTINRELAVLKRGFNLLIQKKKFGDTPHIRTLQENNIRTDFFEHWEYLKLLEVASPHIKPVIKLAYKTGWRSEEIIDMTWDMIDLDNGIITLPPGDYTKNEEGRVFFLDEDLLRMFRNMWSEKMSKKIESPYVFLNRWGRDKIKSFKEAWKKSCERSKIGKRHFHGFRRTAVRNMIRAGVPEKVSMTISGHKTRSVFDRYNITSIKDLQNATKQMEQYLNGQSEEKPIEQPKEEPRDWQWHVITVQGEIEEEQEEGKRRPLSEIMDEITKEYEKQQAEEDAAKNGATKSNKKD